MADKSAQLPATFADELNPATAARSLVTAVLLFVLEFVIVASFAALIYSEIAPAELAQGIGLMVIGNAILAAIVTLLSTYRGSIAIGQDVPAAIFAVAAAGIASASSGASSTTIFITVTVMIALTTLAAGLFFILLGTFKLGNLIRFLPYPVMGGFLAGTGYLLIRGGMGIMTSSAGLALLQPDALIRWVPAVILGFVLFLVSRRVRNPLWIPTIVVAAGVLFYLIAWALGSTPAELIEQGWLVGGVAGNTIWQFPLSPQFLGQTDWPAIAGQVKVLAPMILITAIAMLLNANGLELILKRDLNLNHELVVVGLANIAGGLGGVFAGFHSVSITSLNHSMSGGRRLPGLLMSVLLLASILLGSSLIGYIPKLVLGGLVVFVGFMLLIDWLYDGWFKFPPVDYAIVLLILFVIAWQGFAVGVLVGFIAALLIFVFNYSRTTVIRNTLSGSDYRSRVTRSPESRDALAEMSGAVLILRLQGYIFFGTANSLFEKVSARAEQGTMRYAVLDFERVQGLDSTGILSFQKMQQLAANKDFTLILTAVSPTVKRQLARGGFVTESPSLRYFDNLDRGVEWYEDELLASRAQAGPALASLDEQLQYIWPDPATLRIKAYLTRLEIAEGDVLIRQGDTPDLMYFIESGQVTAQLAQSDGPPTRLETMQGGRMVGELGFFLGTQRTADVVVDQPGVAYSLSRAGLERMRHEDPEAFGALQQVIIQLIGERLINLTRAFEALQE